MQEDFSDMEKGKRLLAVGWFDNKPFVDICSDYVPRIKEIFFAWPGVIASRPMDAWTHERRAQIISDLKWARENGIELDTIFNANCYGDIAMSEELANVVRSVIEEMDNEGLFPEHLTTTSPFIATVVKKEFPAIKIRFSINMDISTQSALKYVDSICDEFYVGRNLHRNLDYVKKMSAWAKEHNKLIGMQANPGCLRNCPYHTFHNNLHGHNRIGQSEAAAKFNFSNFLCRNVFERGNYEEFLRAIWIRPEDLPMYEPYIDVVKLATRRHPYPEKIIAAYANYSYDGDVADIVDPCYKFPKIFDNKSFDGTSLWPSVRDCKDADNCKNCGKCSQLLKQVFKERNEDVNFTSEFKSFFKG